MDEKLFVYLWLFGGFVVAFACLLSATIYRSSRSLRWFCLAGAFCGLVYEGGCFAAASGFGKATGNGGDDGTMGGILAIAFLVAVIWTIFIFLLSSVDKKESVSGTDERVSKSQ
jgi:hypothetical protein